MRKLIALVIIVILAEIAVYFFINNAPLNKGSYSFADFNVSVDQKGKDVVTEISSNNSKIKFGIPIANAKINKAANITTMDTSKIAINYEIKKQGPTRGLKETIILKNQNSPTDFNFNLNLENVSTFKQDPKTKVWHFYNHQNKEIFYIPGGIMEDKNGVMSDRVDISITRNAGGYGLKISADKKWINDAKRAFPIKIDPSVLIPGPRLYLSVTNVGRYRWKLAIEYEIKDQDDRILGSDVIITDTIPGETNEDLSKFLNDYLKIRLATWTIAQGNFSLREMSNDRITSAHFQASDNGDDVDDEHKDERQLRKTLIETFNKSVYPTISLDLSEANLVQNPMQDELDKSGSPTGRKIQINPTFKVVNEEVGAGTEILRPNGAGDATGINGANLSPHWNAVDDVVADEGGSYVYLNNSTTATDYYALTDSALANPATTINSIDVYGRVVNGTYTLTAGYLAGVRLSSTDSNGASHDITNIFSWTGFTDSNITRPGGGSWVVADLNPLQVKITLTSTTQATTCCDTGCDTCCTCTYACDQITIPEITQTYVVVNYTAAAETKVRGGVKIRGGTTLR